MKKTFRRGYDEPHIYLNHSRELYVVQETNDREVKVIYGLSYRESSQFHNLQPYL